nr:cell division protein SepF [uncultured Sellimonas sp.]
MGVFNKFMDIMKLNDNESDYDDDDFFDDEDDLEDYEEKPKKKFFGKDKKNDDEYENEHEEDEMFSSGRSETSTNSKVTPMRHAHRRTPAQGMEVCVIKPSSVEDSREITETLLSGRTVILNLEGLDLEIAQRIIDFTSGATFAIDGNLQRISSFIFLLTPTNVGISGDLQDLLNGSFDVSSISKRY